MRIKPVGQVQRAAVLFSDGAGQRQAQPGAAGQTVARWFAAGKRLEHPLELIGGNARAIVFDPDHRSDPFAGQADPRLLAIAQRVDHQIADRAAQPGRAQLQRDPFRWSKADRLAQILKLLGHLRDQCAQLGRLERVARPADPSERENIVERAGDVLDCRSHLGTLGFILNAFDPDPQG